ncbi:DEAD/DEAH box helicase [Actinomadura algeriensis]|uniref:Replicative superfamily II helicase n=1 Tax=Actinomadura algeriensis TaxID=1679523 RepID=A0ABR9K2J6_9ACTN|nr:DEAD/DEAH box helicase [Actinomadura algeriensis]MBE1537080.1 replicative superfamily II helicase [Actinomadura algeriensis]
MPKLHGVFAGVNMYQNGYAFRELSFAVRDARALQALFEDNVDGETNLSLDREVTKRNFLTEIGHVADRCTPDDLAVISFSGHGTFDGELVMHDSDPDNLHETGLSLVDLVAAVERIPARQLIIVLDCCFVGGHVAGGPALYPAKTAGPRTSEHARSGRPSPEHTLGKIAGDGRVVLAASGEGEVAYEDKWLEHGVLTHHLIQGLLGRGLDVQDDQISLFGLVDYVMKQVQCNPGTVRKGRQNPTLAAVTSGMSIRVFKVGEKYKSIAGDLQKMELSPAFSTLASYGISNQACDVWKQRVGKMTDFQVGVIDRGRLLAGENLLVGAPTSSGKTLLGEIAALKSIAAGRPAVFLVPTRALADEVHDLFADGYAKLGITVVRATGGRRENVPELLAGRFQLAVCTYEKFIGLLQARPELLSKIGVLVVDEIQTIGIPVRGPKLELLLTRIRARRRAGQPVPQVIGLSSAPGTGRMLAEWAAMTPMTGSERLTPLEEGVVSPGGRLLLREHAGAERNETLPGFRQESDARETALDLVRQLVRDDRQVIVFRPQRYQAWTFAKELADVLGLPSAESALNSLPTGDDGRVTERLRACLSHGVAFHIADLSDGERSVVESFFRRTPSEIRVVVATTTLAQGVNLPADCVVVHGLEHPSQRDDARYTVSEYKNMAGRAGRTGHVDEGRALIVADNQIDAEQKWRDYVQAGPQPLRTAFPDTADDLLTTILSLFADPGVGGSRRVDVREMLALTFASYQHRNEPEEFRPFPSGDVDSALGSLCDARLLKREGTGYRMTGLGTVAVRSGLSVASVTALIQALSEVPADGMNSMTLICAAQLTTELGDVRFSGGYSSRAKALMKFRQDLAGRDAPRSILTRMSADDGGMDTFLSRARRAVACYMWSRGSRLVRIEKEISRCLPARSTDPGPVRQAARRAAEVVEAALEIALEVKPDLVELGELLELPSQLEFGVRAGLAPVARHASGSVERHVFLNLADAGLTSASKILDAESEDLLRCAGNDAAVFATVRKAAEAAIEATEEERDGGLDGLID